MSNSNPIATIGECKTNIAIQAMQGLTLDDIRDTPTEYLEWLAGQCTVVRRAVVAELQERSGAAKVVPLRIVKGK